MTLSGLLRHITEILKDCETPALDARVLITHALNIDNTRLLLDSDKEVSCQNAEKIIKMAEKRALGEPAAYITGCRDFWKYSFKTPKGVLVPQPDTETLVETVLNEKINTQKVDVLDLCTGTGCIGISLALELEKAGKTVDLTLSDISPIAVKTAKENAENLLISSTVEYRVLQGNMFEPVKGKKFNIIVSNPPYINSDVIKTLPREVQAEPVLALDGGKDGLDFVRILAENASDYINKDGIVAVEIGFDQGLSSKKIFEQNGFENVEIIKDLGLRDRVVKCRV